MSVQVQASKLIVERSPIMLRDQNDALVPACGSADGAQTSKPATERLRLPPLPSCRPSGNQRPRTICMEGSRQASRPGSDAALSSNNLLPEASLSSPQSIAGGGSSAPGPGPGPEHVLPPSAATQLHCSEAPPSGRPLVSQLSRILRGSNSSIGCDHLVGHQQRATGVLLEAPQHQHHPPSFQPQELELSPEHQVGSAPKAAPGMPDGDKWRHDYLLQQQQQQCQIRPPTQVQARPGLPAPQPLLHHSRQQSPASSHGTTGARLSTAVAQGLAMAPDPLAPAPAAGSASTGNQSLLSQQLRGSRRSSDLGSSAGTSPAPPQGPLGTTLGALPLQVLPLPPLPTCPASHHLLIACSLDCACNHICMASVFTRSHWHVRQQSGQS